MPTCQERSVVDTRKYVVRKDVVTRLVDNIEGGVDGDEVVAAGLEVSKKLRVGVILRKVLLVGQGNPYDAEIAELPQYG